jgi:hypothetical protein
VEGSSRLTSNFARDWENLYENAADASDGVLQTNDVPIQDV